MKKTSPKPKKAAAPAGKQKKGALKVKTGAKGGGSINHNAGLKVKTGAKGGGSVNHNESLLGA